MPNVNHFPLQSSSGLSRHKPLWWALGGGGNGEVYKAIDTRLNRTVAIKLLKGPNTDRLVHEAQLIAALNNPHICAVYDIGPDYLVMEYVEGTPVKGPLPAIEALNLAIQIVTALEAAHSQGIIHRDLKPGNILVNRGNVKLLNPNGRVGSLKAVAITEKLFEAETRKAARR
jgi:serine/threonine protein kinase